MRVEYLLILVGFIGENVYQALMKYFEVKTASTTGIVIFMWRLRLTHKKFFFANRKNCGAYCLWFSLKHCKHLHLKHLQAKFASNISFQLFFSQNFAISINPD